MLTDAVISEKTSMCGRFIAAALLCILWTGGAAFDTASDVGSFYGTSHVTLALQEARSTTSVSLRFRTGRGDALLLVAAGRTDYLLMLLEEGLLKVRVNLGAGEGEVSSPPDRRMDDLLWHDVDVKRKDADVTLTIDGLHVTRIKLPGRFYELNIHYGVFVGGMGDFSEIFLGLLDNFRGCLHEVRFNDALLFPAAREAGTAHGLSWGCDKQFDADDDVSMSFVETQSYLMFPPLLSKLGGSIKLDLKTSSSEALVLYSDAGRRGKDHLIVMLKAGRLRMKLTVDKEEINLDSKIAINDGVWHKAKVTVNAVYVELSVDQTLTSLKPSDNHTAFPAFSSNLFLGGLSEKNRIRAAKQGISNIPVDLQGCVQNLFIDDTLTGMPSVIESKGARAECVWEYPCLRQPCIPNAACIPQGTSEFKCECDQAVCVRSDLGSKYGVYTDGDTHLPDGLQLLSLAPLTVPEAGEALLTVSNIHVMLDYEKYGVRDSGVFFHIREPPKQGVISVDVWRRPDESVFTLLDLMSERVRYLHGGSESSQDVIVLELELFARAGFTLPVYLQTRHKFVLHVSVTPVNDAPVLALPPGGTVRLAAGTRRTLGADVIHAQDPDSRPRELVISILSPAEVGGHMELSRRPGVVVETFTQEQVDDGLVQFVHDDGGDTRLALSVSDGMATSDTVVLRVATFRLEAISVNNTGLRLTHGASSLITTSSLAFTTNAQSDDIDIKFLIVKQTQSGKVQKLRGNGRWQPTSHFTMRHLQRHKVRYRHTSGKPEHDGFKFQVSLKDNTQPTVYDFRIQFLLISVEIVANEELVLNRTQEAVLTRTFLYAEPRPYAQPGANLTFIITSIARFGDLFRLEGSPAQRQTLSVGDAFSQGDIDAGRVVYRLHRKSYSMFTDQFRFRARIPGFESSAHEFNIRHIPPEPKGMISIKRIEVGEGDTAVITQDFLLIAIDGIPTVFYNVTESPAHGSLFSTDEDNARLRYFTSQDISLGQVVYIHDDTESPSDRISFVATSLDPEDDFQYVGSLDISVVMRNDNAPERAATEPLYVVRNKRRAVRPAQLTFSDPDLYTEPTDIEYTRREIPNGALYLHPDYNTEVFQFTQADINADRLVFQHSGEDRARVVLWVTDGAHYTTGVLEIVASEPFVRLNTSEAVTVPRGETVTIAAKHFRPETNVEVADENVKFHVVAPPKHGQVRVRGDPFDSFSLQDLHRGVVVYENDEGSVSRDQVQLEVSVGQLSSNGTLYFHIYPESYWEPLRVINNHSALVAEGDMVTVSQSLLHVMHPNVAPGDIRFTVTHGPTFGFLMLRGPNARPKVMSFNQTLVNDGNLTYVQSVANATEDYFTFSVTNGIVSRDNLRFDFVIIPLQIRLLTHNVTLSEGASVTLTSRALSVASKYYHKRVSTFEVLELPRSGRLELEGRRGRGLSTFTRQQLIGGQVKYVHSGDESRGDCLTMLARTESKASAPGQLCFRVAAVNDHPPSIVNNSGISVVQGGAAVLTASQLDAVDADLPAEDLVFSLTRSECGNLTLREDPSSPVSNFSRSQLVGGQVVFNHTRQDVRPCRLRVAVSDGLHRTPSESFRVRVERIRLRQVASTQLHVFPMMQQAITKGHLLVRTNDPSSARTITYSVIRKPRLGKVTRKQPDGSTQPVSWFTQQDINRGIILYKHNSALTALSAEDSVELRVQTELAAPLPSVVLRIVISVTTTSGGGLQRYVDGAPLRVPEGGKAVVSRSVLDVRGVVQFLRSHSAGRESPDVRLRLTTPPKHGTLQLRGGDDIRETLLTQKDISGRRLTYRHDHSDTVSDSFGYSLLLSTAASSVLLYNGTVNITVVPVNDQKFKLVTASPGITVVQKQTAVIKRENLHVTDPDNPPSEILFTVINGPTRGRIFIKGSPRTRVLNFTQADIDSERLMFSQDGSLGNDQFFFRVWDGVHSPLVTGFIVTTVPLSLSIVRNEPVLITQGQSRVVLTADRILADTNGRRSDVIFNVTVEPSHGRLFVEDSVVTKFTQGDIDSGRVSYTQMNMLVGNDSFVATVYNEYNVVRNETFALQAKPLVATSVLRCVPGVPALISIDVLNASELAELLGSDPRYSLVQSPRFGHVTRILHRRGRAQRNARAWNVTSFRHSDVTQNVIFFVPVDTPLDGNETLSDAVRFELSAERVQPALGQLDVRLVSAEVLEADKTTPGVNSVVGRGRQPDPEPFLHRDYILVGGVVAGVVVTSILLLIVIKCATDRRRHRQQKAENCAPTRLDDFAGDRQLSGSPRSVSRASTPDFINSTLPRPSTISTLPRHELSTPRLRVSSANGSLPRPRFLEQPRLLEPSWPERDMSPSVPQCTVTALYTGAPPPEQKYSYDVDTDRQFLEDGWSHDGSEVSASQPRNPILRKNQYWV